MKRYIGTKTLTARPMTRGKYNEYRGWPQVQGEDPSDAGYLVEYEDGGKPNDERHAGYISWSPADVFERTYRPFSDHRDRVRAEANELSRNLAKLVLFVGGETFTTLPVAEKARLLRQRSHMHDYLDVLNERIEAFDAPPKAIEQHTENPDHADA